MLYLVRIHDCCFRHCPLPWVSSNTIFGRLDVPIIRRKERMVPTHVDALQRASLNHIVQWLRQALPDTPNWVEMFPALHVMIETDPVSDTLCSKELKTIDNIHHNSHAPLSETFELRLYFVIVTYLAWTYHADYLDNQGYKTLYFIETWFKIVQNSSEWYHVGLRFLRTGR